MWRWRRRRARRVRRRSRRLDAPAGGTTSRPADIVAGVRGNGGRVPSVISWWISRPSAVPSSAPSHACLPKTCSAGSRPARRPRSRRPAARTRGSVRACASTVAAMAPAEVAVMMSGTIPSTPTRYCSTPTSKEPLVPPPARTNAVGPEAGFVRIGDSGTARSAAHNDAQPPAAAVTTSTRDPARAGVRGPLRARDDTAVDGDGHPLGIVVRRELRHEVGDGGTRRHLRPARRSRGA